MNTHNQGIALAGLVVQGVGEDAFNRQPIRRLPLDQFRPRQFALWPVRRERRLRDLDGFTAGSIKEVHRLGQVEVLANEGDLALAVGGSRHPIDVRGGQRPRCGPVDGQRHELGGGAALLQYVGCLSIGRPAQDARFAVGRRGEGTHRRSYSGTVGGGNGIQSDPRGKGPMRRLFAGLAGEPTPVRRKVEVGAAGKDRGDVGRAIRAAVGGDDREARLQPTAASGVG